MQPKLDTQEPKQLASQLMTTRWFNREVVVEDLFLNRKQASLEFPFTSVAPSTANVGGYSAERGA